YQFCVPGFAFSTWIAFGVAALATSARTPKSRDVATRMIASPIPANRDVRAGPRMNELTSPSLISEVRQDVPGRLLKRRTHAAVRAAVARAVETRAPFDRPGCEHPRAARGGVDRRVRERAADWRARQDDE